MTVRLHPRAPADATAPHPTVGEGWRDTRVLVTGASGFIGAHLTARLGALGATVHGVSRREIAAAPTGPTWHRADLDRADAAGELVATVRPDVVFHLASAVTGDRDPALVGPTLAANLTGAVNLLAAAAQRPGTRIVLAGSVEEPRDAEAVASSPYAAAKWAATGYARMFHRLWDVAVTVLRVAMVYGPGQPDTAKLLPYATLALLRGERPRLASGTRLVDWVYVDDVVDAFLAAARSPRAIGEVVDVGSGVQVSIRETVERLARVLGSPLTPVLGAVRDRPLDRPQLADPEPAAELLGWRPLIGLDEGLRRTVAWYAEQAGRDT